MNVRKTLSTVAFCTLIAFYAGRAIVGIHDKKEAQKLHDAAATVAQEYLQSKYHFSVPMCDDSEYPKRQEWLLSRNVYEFSAEYGGRSFAVWVNMPPEGETCCKDSYQFEDMRSELEGRITSKFPSAFITMFWLGDNDEWQKDQKLHGGFSDYYDGTNLDEIIMKSGTGTIKLCIAGDSFAGSGIDQMLSDLNFTYCLTAFDTEEHLEEFKKHCNPQTDSFSRFFEYQCAAPYLTEHIDNFGQTKSELHIDLIPCGDFLYAYLPSDTNHGFPASEPLAPPVQLDTNEFIGKFEYSGSKYTKAYDEREYVDTPISDAWHVDCRYGDIMIYYPLEKLRDYNPEELGMAWFSYSGQSNNRNIEKPVIFGDYAVFRLPYAEMDFMLADMRGKGQYIPGWAQRQ